MPPKIPRYRVARAALVAAALLALTGPGHAASSSASTYLDAAKKLIDKGDLRGAEIQLRNAVRDNSTDPDVHVALARVYLELGNLPAAEAEAQTARDEGGDEDAVAPVLAEAMLGQNQLSQLLDQVKPADRDPSAESVVRMSLGLAHMGLQEFDQAAPLLQRRRAPRSQGMASQAGVGAPRDDEGQHRRSETGTRRRHRRRAR